MTYLKATGGTKRWCRRHHRFDCKCGRPQKDYKQIDNAICRVLEIHASPDKPMPPRRIQRMIRHFGIERQFIYRDLRRLEDASILQRHTCQSGYFLS